MEVVRRPLPLRGIAVSLWFAVIVASLLLVYVSHQCRELYDRLAQMERHGQQLEVAIGQYMLEQSTWGSLPRIEKIATEKLAMRIPETDEMVIVGP